MMSPKASDKPVGLKGSKKGLGPAALAQTVSTSTSGDSETNKFRAQLNQCWALLAGGGCAGGGGDKARVQSPAPWELGVRAHTYNPNA